VRAATPRESSPRPDAVRVAADATPADEATVEEYMTSGVETVWPDDSRHDVARRMVAAGISPTP